MRIDHEGGRGRIVMLAARQVMEVGGREISGKIICIMLDLNRDYMNVMNEKIATNSDNTV